MNDDGNYHKPHGFEWLRLITPILLFVIAFMINNIWTEIQKVAREQARRTVIVQEAYLHMKDKTQHVNHSDLDRRLDRIDQRLSNIEKKIR